MIPNGESIGISSASGRVEVNGWNGTANGKQFRVYYSAGGSLLNTEFSALTHITHIPDVNGWTALYAKQGSAKKAGVFDGDVSINGYLHTKEVKVDLTGWADFVFEKEYQLPTLYEVEAYIKKNGHLKDIPNAKDVEENGIFIGEMNSKLLQKIEELTLYMIDFKKEMDKVSLENQKLKQRLGELEQALLE